MNIFGYEVSILYIILGSIATTLVCTLLFLSRSGLFYTITLRLICPLPEVVPQRAAYLVARGPYKHVGYLVRQTMDLAPNCKTFAIYYDDPDKVSSTDLQSIVGCMLPEDSERLSKFLETTGYTLHTFPPCKNALVTEYPNYTFISILLANWRIFPEIVRMMEKKKIEEFPVIEIYASSYIKYIVPIDNMAKFYVPGIERRQKTHVE